MRDRRKANRGRGWTRSPEPVVRGPGFKSLFCQPAALRPVTLGESPRTPVPKAHGAPMMSRFGEGEG